MHLFEPGDGHIDKKIKSMSSFHYVVVFLRTRQEYSMQVYFFPLVYKVVLIVLKHDAPMMLVVIYGFVEYKMNN